MSVVDPVEFDILQAVIYRGLELLGDTREDLARRMLIVKQKAQENANRKNK